MTKEETKEYNRQYYNKNREIMRKQGKVYYQAHKDSIKSNVRSWVGKNTARRAEYQKEYQATNKADIQEQKHVYHIKNRKKFILKTARYRQAHPQECRDAMKNSILKKKYGITLAQFEQMLTSQNRKCAICNGDLMGKSDTHVDHSHATNKIRQLLCRFCNIGLGHFRDDPELTQRATEYLKKWKV
jgi:hypothetical protein